MESPRVNQKFCDKVKQQNQKKILISFKAPGHGSERKLRGVGSQGQGDETA